MKHLVLAAFLMVPFAALAGAEHVYTYSELSVSVDDRTSPIQDKKINCGKVKFDFGEDTHSGTSPHFTRSLTSNGNEVGIGEFSKSLIREESVYTARLFSCSAISILTQKGSETYAYLAHSLTGPPQVHQNYYLSTKEVASEIEHRQEKIASAVLHMSQPPGGMKHAYPRIQREYDAALCYVLDTLKVESVLVVNSYKDMGLGDFFEVTQSNGQIEFNLQRMSYFGKISDKKTDISYDRRKGFSRLE